MATMQRYAAPKYAPIATPEDILVNSATLIQRIAATSVERLATPSRIVGCVNDVVITATLLKSAAQRYAKTVGVVGTLARAVGLAKCVNAAVSQGTLHKRVGFEFIFT